MLTKESILFAVSVLGIFQSLFFTLYLLFLKEGNRTANRLLAFLLLAISARVGKSVINNFYEISFIARNIGLSFMLCWGPINFLYAREVLSIRQFSKNSWLHFIPALCMVLLAGIIPNEPGYFWSRVVYTFILGQWLIYILISFRNYVTVKNDYDNKIAAYNVGWVFKLLAGASILWLAYTLVFLRVMPLYLFGAVVYSLLCYAMLYMYMKRQVLFISAPLPKYKSSQLTMQEVKGYYQKIVTALEKEKVFLQPDLSVSKLSSSVGLSPRVVSQVINQEANTTVPDFINRFRVKEAQRIIDNSPGVKISGLVTRLDLILLLFFMQPLNNILRFLPANI